MVHKCRRQCKSINFTNVEQVGRIPIAGEIPRWKFAIVFLHSGKPKERNRMSSHFAQLEIILMILPFNFIESKQNKKILGGKHGLFVYNIYIINTLNKIQNQCISSGFHIQTLYRVYRPQNLPFVYFARHVSKNENWGRKVIFETRNNVNAWQSNWFVQIWQRKQICVKLQSPQFQN